MEKLYEMFAKAVAETGLIVASLTLGAFIIGFPFRWAWNVSMPGIFHLKEIGYWEAFALIWVAGTLVKASPKS